MGRGRKDEEIDWRSVFLSYFSDDVAVGGASSDSPTPVDEDGEPYSRTRRPAAKAPVGLAPDVVPPAASKDPVGLGPDVPPAASKDPVGLGVDFPPPASKDVYDFSPMDEDEHVSPKQRSELSPKSIGQKKNEVQLPLNKGESQGRGGKRKPSSNKGRARATDPEESDYESTLPSRLSKRRKGQLQNSASVYSQKVQDVILLDDEDMEPKEEVNHEMSDGLNEPKMYYPSRDDQEAVELTRSDIKCLNPEVFLSSPMINFYIKYIKKTILCNENFRDKFYIFNTYFFGKLEEALHQPRDYPKLRRWWKGVNIFNNAYIILPIHEREHWSLVIICLPPKVGISEPIILHLDSLGMHRSTKILNTVERYLEREWDFLSVAEAAWPCLQSDIRKEAVQVPQQNNAYDCGIFMLYYIEQFIKEAPARFTTDKLGMFNPSWFKPEEASGLRHRIRELLLEEFESARLNDAISKADASKRHDSIKDGELEAADNSKMVVEVGVRLGNTTESNGGMKVVAASEEANGESGDAVTGIGGIKVVASSQEASEKSRGAGNKIIEGMKVAASEEASGKSGDVVKNICGIMVVASQEASEKSRGASNIIEVMEVAASEEASGELGDDAVKSTGGIKAAASQETSEECQNASKSINVAESEETSGVSRDTAKSIKGISVAELDEASGECGDTSKTRNGIKVAASEEAHIDSGYTASTEDNADVTLQNKGPTSNTKPNKNNNGGGVLSKAAPCSHSVKDKKGTVETYPGSSSKAEKQGKSNVMASPGRLNLKGSEKVMGSTPIPNAASDSGAKRSEENEDATTGSVPITDLVWETTGATVRITKIYRRTSGTTLEPGNWCWSAGGSSRDARRSFIQHFCRKK